MPSRKILITTTCRENNARKSLVVTHERFYNSGEGIEITAQYFNKNYEFDTNSNLQITYVNEETGEVITEFPHFCNLKSPTYP